MENYIFIPASIMLRVLEAFSQLMLGCIILNIEDNYKKMFIGSFIYVVVYETLSRFLPQSITFLLILFVCTMILILIFKESWWKAITGTIVMGIITSLVYSLVCFTLLKALNLQIFKQIVENAYIYVPGQIMIDILVLFIAWTVKFVRNKYKGQETRHIFVLLSSFISFLVLVPNLMLVLYCHDKKELPVSIITVNICAIIGMFIINAYNARKTYQAIRLEQELKIQQDCNVVLQEMVDGLRSFKHDYANTLQTLYGYAQLDNIEKLKDVLIQVIDEGKMISSLGKLNPNVIKNPSLYGLLIGKNEKANKYSVKMDLEILGDVEKLDIPIFDLTRVLGIFMDNAIEAAAGSRRKRITFMVTERRYDVAIEIINTYSEKQLQAITLYKKGDSTKGEGRGLGLCKAKEIIGKYPDILHQTLMSNGQFLQSLTIPKVRDDYKK